MTAESTGAVALRDKPQNPIAQFRSTLLRMEQEGEFSMLPSTVSFDAFRNAAVVAVSDNPDILRCDRGSLFRALRKLAAKGLVPDNREAALVAFNGQAQPMTMVFGAIKAARNSGEVVSIWAEVVYDNEELRLWIENGERKFDHKYDPMRRGGEIVGAYAVAKLRDGTIEFEPMGLDAIEKRRKVSRTQKGEKPSGVWAQWYVEMAKKTVIHALCRRLPVSAEDMRRIAEIAMDDDPEPPAQERPSPRRGGVVYRDEPADEIVDAETGEITPRLSDADADALAAEVRARTDAEAALFGEPQE